MDHPDQEGILILKHKASHSMSFTQSFMQGNYQRGNGHGGKVDRGMQVTTQLFSALFSIGQLSGP